MAEPAPHPVPVTVTVPLPHDRVAPCPGGPLLLRGKHLVRDAEGTEHPTTRPVSAVCRCGHSAVPPWCDGTHKVVRTAWEPTEPWHVAVDDEVL